LDYDVALSPDTDWTTIPPTVYTTSRDLHGWSNGAYAYISATSPPVVKVNVTDNWAQESGAGNGIGVFQIECTPDCTGEDIIFVISGTATLTDDYTIDETSPLAITGSSDLITVTIVNDTDIEPLETVVITLTPNAAYTIDVGTGTIYLNDNDGVVYDYGKNVMRGGVLR